MGRWESSIFPVLERKDYVETGNRKRNLKAKDFTRERADWDFKRNMFSYEMHGWKANSRTGVDKFTETTYN